MQRILFFFFLAILVFFEFFIGSFCKRRPNLDSNEEASSSGSLLEEEIVQQGKQLFKENACHSCHGLEGRGDGPAGRNLKPPPRDYRDISSYKQGSSLEDITNTLSTGVPGTTMASYAHLPKEKRRAIASYVIYLQKTQTGK